MNNDIKKRDNDDFEVVYPDSFKPLKDKVPLPDNDDTVKHHLIDTNAKSSILRAFEYISGTQGTIFYNQSLELTKAPDLHELRANLLKNYSYNSYNLEGIDSLTIVLNHLFSIKENLK